MSSKFTFLKWLGSNSAKIYKIPGAVAAIVWIISSVAVFGKYVFVNETPLNEVLIQKETIYWRFIFHFIHCIACLIMGYVSGGLSILDTPRDQTIIEPRNRILTALSNLFYSLALLYFVKFAVIHFTNPKQFALISSILEVITTVFIFSLFLELSIITTISSTGEISAKNKDLIEKPKRYKKLYWTLACGFIVANFFALFFLVASDIQHIPISQTFSDRIQFFSKISRVSVGILSGITLAMVVGRLGSFYIQPGNFILALLYLYAVLQGYTEDLPIVDLVITTFALPLKILLWLVFVYSFSSGKITEYIEEGRKLLQDHEIIEP